MIALTICLILGIPSGDARAQSMPLITWYRSNVDFLELERREEGPAAGWWLAVRRDESSLREVRLLYYDRELRGGEEITHDATGIPREILRYTLSAGEEVTEWRGDFGPGWELEFRIALRYRPDNTVRRIVRDAGDERVVIRYAPPGAAGIESVDSPDLQLSIRYSASSRPEYIRRERPHEPDAPPEEEWFQYEQGRLVYSRTEIGPEQVERRYRDGRIVSEETRRDGRIILRRLMERDEDGTLLEERRETRNRVETERFFPSATDGVVREERVNGQLVEREVRVSREERPEPASVDAAPAAAADRRPEVVPAVDRRIDRYQDGEVLYRTWYSDDVPRYREVFHDGEVVHVERIEE